MSAQAGLSIMFSVCVSYVHRGWLGLRAWFSVVMKYQQIHSGPIQGLWNVTISCMIWGFIFTECYKIPGTQIKYLLQTNII